MAYLSCLHLVTYFLMKLSCVRAMTDCHGCVPLENLLADAYGIDVGIYGL